MTITTHPERRSPSVLLEDLPMPFMGTLGTVIEDAWVRSPGPSSARRERLERAEHGQFGLGLPEGALPDLARRAYGRELPQGMTDRRPALSPMLSADEARARVGTLGLTIPDEGIRADTLDILIDTKTEEVRRQAVMARAGVGTQIMGGVIGSMLDPMNVGLAFVPVVSQARFAIWAGRIGVPGARVATGVVEGVAGAALVEPVVLAAARAEQADYDMLDSLMNIAIGGPMGGGLHLAAGTIGDVGARVAGRPSLADRLAMAPARTRETLLRTAVAQATDGQGVDVGPVARTAPEIAPALTPTAQPAAPARTGPSLADAPEADFTLGAAGPTGRWADYSPIAPGDRQWIEGVVAELEQTQSGERIFREVDGQGSTPDIMGVKADTPAWFQAANRSIAAERKRVQVARRQQATMPLEQHVEIPAAPAFLTRRTVRDTAKRLLAGKPLGKQQGMIAEEIMGAARDNRRTNAEGIVDMRRDRRLEGQRRRDQEEAEIKAIADREAEFWRRDSAADPQAMDEATATVEEAGDLGNPDAEAARIEAELAEAEAELATLRQAGDLTAEEEAALEAAAEFGAIAEQEGAAYRAAARCMVGL